MKILCLGDSFTAGYGVHQNENWISLSDSTAAELINRGVNGDTTSGMLARFHNDVIREKPRYVLITGGINDFISGSGTDIPQNNYMSMVHQAFSNNIIPIIGIEPGFNPSEIRKDWQNFADFDIVLNNLIRLRTWLLNLSDTFNIYCIDFYKELQNSIMLNPGNDYYIDGIHLTPYGHKCINRIFISSLALL